jgi:hypothetical protein
LSRPCYSWPPCTRARLTSWPRRSPPSCGWSPRASACLLLFAALNISTGEGFFLNTVTANLNDFRWERVSLNALGALLACPLLLLSSLAFLLLTPRKGNNAWWLVAPYLLASIPTAVLVG